MSIPNYPETWQLLVTPPAAGTWNMAVDEFFLEEINKNPHSPILRLFAWDPPCLSLGYAQSHTPFDLEKIKGLGWDLVRRPTGGKAVLHTDEITYSLIAPSDHWIAAGGVLPSYQRIAAALLSVLKILSVQAQAEKTYMGFHEEKDTPVCFEQSSNYEITCQSRKLIGSAQARRPGAILQHGSLPLFGDLNRIGKTLRATSGSTSSEVFLKSHAVTLEEITGRMISWEEAKLAFINGFQKSLSIGFNQIELDASALSRIAYWMENKYANPEWTYLR